MCMSISWSCAVETEMPSQTKPFGGTRDPGSSLQASALLPALQWSSFCVLGPGSVRLQCGLLGPRALAGLAGC